MRHGFEGEHLTKYEVYKKFMTLKEFTELLTQEQLNRVLEIGVLVGHREDADCEMFLYQMHAFYVEVSYHKEDGRLLHIMPFEHHLLLDPYLDQIDLSSLF